MLYQLGSITFEVWPFNMDSYARDTGYDFATKDTIGNQRPLEAMGEGDEQINISGRLFPEKFGGLDDLDTLDKMRASGTAHILVRGDGKNMGWFVITRVTERASFINREGIGRQIDFDIMLNRSQKPSAASLIQTLLRLFT